MAIEPWAVSERVARTGGAIELSDEERERRSAQAKRLIAEGKFGPAAGRGGRPGKLKTKLAVRVANQISAMDESRLALASAMLSLVGTLPDDDAALILDAVLRRGRH